ncbi:MAG: class I SAM-dependent methyltransferase [Bryobacteraceae bacterium]|nr:class I SAM-dependent methyltransferase [Bryobacteraceae bacterium]
MATATVISDRAAERRDALVERIFDAALGAFSTYSIYIGDRLGYYTALAQDGPLSADELARRTGTAERYAREWLEQQAVYGIVEAETGNNGAGERRFYLPSGHDEALADSDSLNFMAPLAQAVVGALGPIASVLEAFRTGGGVPYADYGADMREGQARMNRTAFLQLLPQEWIAAMPDVRERLAEPGARVADVGCGAGWSSIGVAMHYPNVQVDGFDLDEPSIEMARANAGMSGVGDRVRFETRDAADPELRDRYDLVMACECVHDMSDPVSALRTMRRLTKPGGAVLVVDERAGERFDPAAGNVERLLYGFSVVHCLPAGMADQPSCGTGTVMRPGTLAQYAEMAGFRGMEVLPVDHPMFRLYRLRP